MATKLPSSNFVLLYEGIKCRECGSEPDRFSASRDWRRSQDFSEFICAECWHGGGGVDGRSLKDRADAMNYRYGTSLGYEWVPVFENHKITLDGAALAAGGVHTCGLALRVFESGFKAGGGKAICHKY